MHWLVCKLNPGSNYKNDHEIVIDRQNKVETYFIREDAAHAAAKDLAVAHPTNAYAVLGILKVYETTIPNIVTKKIDERGQLVVDRDV